MAYIFILLTEKLFELLVSLKYETADATFFAVQGSDTTKLNSITKTGYIKIIFKRFFNHQLLLFQMVLRLIQQVLNVVCQTEFR
jgi:hypothetical protein